MGLLWHAYIEGHRLTVAGHTASMHSGNIHDESHAAPLRDLRPRDLLSPILLLHLEDSVAIGVSWASPQGLDCTETEVCLSSGYKRL